MTATQDLIVESAGRLFADLFGSVPPSAPDPAGLDRGKWDRVVELGLPLALVPEEAGGFGLEPAEAMAVVRLAGRWAVPLPLAETMLANRLLAGAGVPVPDGVLTLAGGGAEDRLGLARDGGGWRLTGTAHRVPWGRSADAVAAVADGEAGPCIVLATGTVVAQDANLAGEPRDTLSFDCALPAGNVGPGGSGAPLRLLGAALRSAAMAGALARVLEMTTAYANERVQFGRPIGKFQAIQQSLAVMAGHVAAAGAAADMAAEAVATGALLPIAAAKVRCGEAAGIVAAAAHQIHGAIGFTREHGLHLLTRRLWSWRDEFGGEAEWGAAIGRLARAEGADGLWPLITAA
jgi:alkylation response protein AidB-like acyl-CoA dehydrogenase